MVTNAEYSRAMNAVNNQYTADSLQNYQTAYKDYMSQWMSSKEAVNKAKSLLVEKGNNSWTATRTTPVSSPYENQGAGNYVYNEKTWYYENQTDTSRNTTNQGLAPRPENVKTETPTKQQETVVKTDTWIKQQGQLKPLSQDYYNQTSDEAQNKIRANLNWYRQTNPELFSDYETFKKNFSYDARDEVQKQTLDNWYTWYQKSMELSAVPTNELYTQYKDWTVSLSDLETLRISNPEKYAELQATINKWNIISAYDDDKGEDTTWMSIQDMAYNAAMQMFTKWMSGDTSSGASQIFREYEEKMNDPEMLELADNCTEVENEIENIQMDLDSMKKSVEKEYEWTWASRAKINAIVWDRTYELQLQLRTLNSIYNKYATQYNNRMQQYQTEFNMQLQEYQINQNERQTQMKELGFALDLMNFETNDQKQEREWNYWVKQQEYQNWNINSKDYQTRYKAALTSVQNLLSQYEGIPMERSAEQMAQDILTAIDWGSDLGTELTKINKLIQQKPEYKYLYNNTYWKSNDVKYDTFKLWDQEYILYNNELMSAEEFNKKYWNKAEGSTWDAKPYDIVSSDKFTIKDANWYTVSWTLGSFLASTPNQEWKTWGWCGAYVNKYLKSIWVWSNYYDDELSTKVNSVNSQVPKVWSIAVYDYWHITKETGKNHGHVGIVVAVHEDGTYDVMDSNYGSDKKIQLRQNLNPQSSNCKWFFDPSQPPAWSSSSGWNTLNQSKDAFTAAWNNIALNLWSVSATNTFNEQLQNYLDKGDYTRAFEYITTQAKNKADSDTKQAINSAESAISALVSIQHGLDAFYEAWWDTWIFAWTTEQVANKIWKTTDPQLKQLATQINVAIQKYRQAISWAAFSEQEAAEYASIFPSTKNDKELNTALIDWTLQTMLQNLTSSYAQILWTSTYTDLLQAYQDSTWNIYDYYWNKDTLSKYLENNGYLNRTNSINMWNNLSNDRYMSVMSDYSKSMWNSNVINVWWYDFPSTF